GLGSEGTITLTGDYSGDTNHAISSGSKDLTATKRATSTTVACVPATLPVNSTTSCTVTVTDTAAGTTSTPTGSVALSQSPLSSGTISNNTCGTLSSGGCTFDYKPGLGSEGTITLTGDYSGDTNHAISSGSKDLSPSTTLSRSTVACVPATLPVNSTTSCT